MSRGKVIAGAALFSLVLLGMLAALAQTAEKPPTELYVRTSPPGAKILVDGKQCGSSPGLFEVEPGEHTVTVELAGHEPKTKKVSIRDGRIRRVILELQKAPEAREARDEKTGTGGVEAPWGKAVEGVRCRLQADRSVWKPDDVPTFKVEVLNRGTRSVRVAASQEGCTLVLDGKTYHWPGFQFVEALPLHPGSGYEVRISVPKTWFHGGPVWLTPGKHKLTVRFSCLGVGSDSEKLVALVESNTVEFEIRAAGATPLDDREKPQTAETEARRVVESFLAAAVAGRTKEAIRMTDPASAVGHQLEDIRTLDGAAAMKVAQVRVKDNTALAVTTEVKDDRDRKSVLLIRLIRSGSRWVVEDIDFICIPPLETTLMPPLEWSSVSEAIKFSGPRNPRETKNPPAEAGPAWGEPVDGVQCRVRAEKPTWPQGTVPKLFADLRNRGQQDLRIAIESESWEIEIDGTWHRPNTAWSGGRRYLPLGPGTEQKNLEVWIPDVDNLAEKLRALPPGKHTLRVARLLNHPWRPANEVPRLVSNPIEIEIVAAKPTAASGIAPEATLSCRKLFSASHGQGAGVLAVAFSPDGLTLAAVDETGQVTVLAADSGRATLSFPVLTPQEKKLLLHEDRQGRIHTASIAYAPDGYTLAVAADPVVRLYDAQSGRLLRTLEDKQLITALKELNRPPATVSRELELLKSVPHAHGRVYCVAFSPDGTMLATSGSHLIRADGSSVISAELATPGKLKLWDAKTGELKRDVGECVGEWYGAVRSVAFSPDGKTLASIGSHPPGWTSSVQLWDPQTGTVESTHTIRRGGLEEELVAFSPDGKLLAASAFLRVPDPENPGRLAGIPGRGLMILDARTGNLLHSRVPPGLVTSLSFSADSKTLATGVEGRGVALWDPQTLEPVEIQPPTDLPRDVKGPVQVAFSPIGSLLAVGARNDRHGFVAVWEIGEPEDHAPMAPAR